MKVTINYDIEEFMEKLDLEQYEDCDSVVVSMNEDETEVIIEIRDAK